MLSAVRDPAGNPARAAVERAMRRLLGLGGVRARSATTLEVAGCRLHYLEAGAGAPLVLVQGAGGGCANWFRVMAPLSANRRVLSLDLPGFGLSAPLAPRPPLGEQGAAVLRAWLDVVGVETCDVVATSFGGLIALRLVQREPERVRRLVLMDVVGLGRDLPLAVRLATLPGVGPLALRPSRAGARWQFRTLLTTDRSRLSADEEDALVDYLWRSAAAGDADAMYRSLRLFAGPRGQREVLRDDELAGIRIPVLLLWGERDRFLPLAHAHRAARHLPRATVRVIPGAGHSPNWERPDEVVAAVSGFLERDSGSSNPPAGARD